MKSRIQKLPALLALAAILCVPLSALAQSVLGTAGNFALLGGTAVTSDGTAGTIITNGNVGSSVAVTGFNDTHVGAGPGVVTPPSLILVGNATVGTARLDLITAINGLSGLASTATMSSVDLGGKTLAPGVYTFAAAASQNGDLVLDAQGKNNVSWVFQIGTTLTTSAGAKVTIINLGSNGGSDDGIFWVARTGGINFGANNRILGNYLAETTISFTIGTTGILGSRALSKAGVTLIQNQINPRGGPSGSDWTGGLTPSGTDTVAVVTNPSSRIGAFSARSQAGGGSQTLIMGYMVLGDNKTLLMRGLGQSLNIPNTLADPQVAFFNGNSPITSNDDWATGGNAAQITSLTTQVGLAQLATGSKEAALVAVVNHGVYTTRVTGANSTTGTALAELYDADSNTSARLAAVSARMQVNADDGILIGGVQIRGNAPKTLVIRGIGPGLTAFGVTGVLADPQLTVFSGSTVIAGNDNWETGNNVAQINAVFAQVGEFPLATGSKDAALLLTLQPGAYTIQLSGVGNTAGVALIEIYEVQ